MVIGRHMQVLSLKGNGSLKVTTGWTGQTNEHTTFKMTTDYGILNKKRANIYMGQNNRDKYIVYKDR